MKSNLPKELNVKKKIGKYLAKLKGKRRKPTPEEEKVLKEKINDSLMETMKKQRNRLRHHHTPGKF